MKREKRTVQFDGRTYRVRSDKIEIPNLGAMNRFAAIIWLNRETYPTGYSKPNPLAGLSGVIQITGR